MNKNLNVDEFEELKDRLEEQMADTEERQQFFINAGESADQDDLLNELDELEAEMAGEEMDFEIGSGSVAE